jgi:hypothetical protein
LVIPYLPFGSPPSVPLSTSTYTEKRNQKKKKKQQK